MAEEQQKKIESTEVVPPPPVVVDKKLDEVKKIPEEESKALAVVEKSKLNLHTCVCCVYVCNSNDLLSKLCSDVLSY